jgi:hypothetical protein
MGWTSSIHAQQAFPSEPRSDVSRVSKECIEILRTEPRHCDDQLFRRADRTINAVTDVLPVKELNNICVPKCREQLLYVRRSWRLAPPQTAPFEIVTVGMCIGFPAGSLLDGRSCSSLT